MATIRARGKKKVFHALWWVSVPTPSGKRKSELRQKSTGTSDKKIAQDIADKWEKESRRPEAELSMEQMRRAMAEIYRRMKNKDAELKMTFREFGKRWLRAKEVEGVQKSTLAFYNSAVNSFADHLDAQGRGSVQLFEISPADVTDYRDLMAQSLARSTVNHHIKALRMIFTAARNEGWTPDNAASQVKTLKMRRADKQKARPFTIDQAKQVLEACDDEWQSMVRVAFYTGKRLVDVALLMESQVNLVSRRIKWQIVKTDSTETSPIHRTLHEALMNRAWSDRGDRPMHPRAHELVMKATGTSRTSALSKQFEHILIRAGLRCAKNGTPEKKVAQPSRRRPRAAYSFHSLRHTLSTELARVSVDKRVAMELVGHEDEDIHEGYTHLPFELLSEGIEKLPEL